MTEPEMSVQQEPQTAEEWRAAYFRMMELRNTAHDALAQAKREREEARLFGERQAAKVIDLRAEVERLTFKDASGHSEKMSIHEWYAYWQGRAEQAEAALARVRGVLAQAITGHENLYKATFGEQADPNNDMVYREMRAALEGRG